jgi:hypothetical protein
MLICVPDVLSKDSKDDAADFGRIIVAVYGLKRFKVYFRTISNSRFRIVLIWMDSNIPMPQSH